MNDLRLVELLRRADALEPPPAVPADLAGRARQGARQRARRRAAGRAVAAAAGVCLLLLAAARFAWPPGPVPVAGPSTRPAPAPPPAPALADVASLRSAYEQSLRDADVRRRTVDLLLARERHARSAVRPAAGLMPADPLDEVAAQRDRAAKVLVDFGDAMAAGPSNSGRRAAAAAYREAVALFPDSVPAARARAQLGRPPA